MVGRKRRRMKTAGSHQRCWLWGRHAVLESLRASRWLPTELWFAADLEPETLEEVRSLSGPAGVELHEVDAERLTQLVGTLEHQGLAGKMPEFECDSIEIAARSAGDAGSVWLVLDRIHDPHNLGAILRSVEVLGGSGVIVSSSGQAEVTPHVARSSAGAVHHVPIIRVDNLAAAVSTLNRQVIVTDAGGDTTLDKVDFRPASIVVLGNEGSGVSRELAELADVRAVIPQQGRVGSLNVGVAAGVILYEALRQRLTAG